MNSATASGGKPRSIRGLRWWIIFTCFLATTINYLDRQCLSVTAPAISKEFGFSNADYSTIITSFLIAYTIMQAVSGRVIDFIGTRLGMAACIVVWSVAGILHAFGNGLWSFRIFRFLLGVGEAGNWPGATKVVSEWFSPRERGLAVGIFDSGSSLGGMLAPPIVAAVTLHFGWQPAFVVTGLLGFLWLWLWLKIYRRPEEHPRISRDELAMISAGREADESDNAPRIPWVRLLGMRAVWGVIMGRFLSDCVWWFYVYWLPKYLSDARGFSLAEIGCSAWIPFVMVDFGNLAGGWFSGWLLRRGWSLNAARKTILALGALGMLAGVPAGFTAHSGICLGLIAIATLAYSAWGTMMLTLPADLFGSRTVASVSGLSGMGAGAGGIAFTWAIGLVVDKFSYQPVFIAAGVMPLVALLSVQILIPKMKRMDSAPS
jgi:ACS family hexuronate transporter-like MFS transporter